jgi:hypothetical protein
MVRKHNIITFVVFSLLILFAGCSSEPQVEIPKEFDRLENLKTIPKGAEPAYGISFSKEASFGETEDVIVGGIMDVTVDEQGRVYIADGDQNVIHAYGPSGDYIQKIGKEGKGPGEFTMVSLMRHDDNQLYALDMRQRRINVFDLESLDFSHAISLSQEGDGREELSSATPNAYYVRDNGNLMVSYEESMARDQEADSDRSRLYYLMDQEGNIISDKLLEQQTREFIMDESGGRRLFMTPPYARRPNLATGPNNKMYTNWSEHFLVKQYNAEGEYQHAIYYPYSQSSLDISNVVKEFEGKRFKNLLRNADNPDTWPTVNSLMVDEQSRMWLSTYTDDGSIYRWWVISNDGELLAQFDWPKEERIEAVENGKLFARKTDEETGLEKIVRYDIGMSEND